MKKKVWGYTKCNAVISELCIKPIYKGNNKNKVRRRRILKLRMREHRPKGGYPVYWVRRSKPYNMLKSDNFYEECKYFWIEEFGE